jgi:hypothetical protein
VKQVVEQSRLARRLQADDRDDEQFPILNAPRMKKKKQKKGSSKKNFDRQYAITMTMKQARPAHSTRYSCQETLEVHH